MTPDLRRKAVSSDDEMIDLRDVIARVEELEDQRDAEEEEEFKTLSRLLEDCKGEGGDEQWRGDWYPVTLIRDSYFVTYAQELADDIGLIEDNAKWPYTCIDWEKAASELQYDYTSVEFEGVTYWTR